MQDLLKTPFGFRTDPNAKSFSGFTDAIVQTKQFESATADRATSTDAR